jgi:DNA polymerase-3 subunit delta
MRIVVLHGKEAFLIGERSRRYTDMLREAYGDVARFDFDGETAEIADVLDELRSLALFEPHKLVVVDAADKFVSERGSDEDAAKPKKRSTGRRRILEAYAEKPVEQASLLLRADSWRPGKLDKLVNKVGAVIKCAPLKEAEAIKWCVDACPRRHGAKIDRNAARLLVERVGVGLARLDTELAKLVAFAGDGTIGPEEVRELVGRSREEQAWALQSAIMSGSAAEACTKLRELLEISRIDETLVTWAITDLLRRIHTAGQLIRQGVGEHTFKHSLRLAWPPGDRMLDVARRAEPRRIAELFNEAVGSVQRTRSSLGDPVRNLEVLTVRVTDTIKCT